MCCEHLVIFYYVMVKKKNGLKKLIQKVPKTFEFRTNGVSKTSRARQCFFFFADSLQCSLFWCNRCILCLAMYFMTNPIGKQLNEIFGTLERISFFILISLMKFYTFLPSKRCSVVITGNKITSGIPKSLCKDAFYRFIVKPPNTKQKTYFTKKNICYI